MNTNYRKNGWDIFGTFKYNRSPFIQESKMTQNTYVDTLWTQTNTIDFEALKHTLTAVAGVNYEISLKHYMGIKYTHTAFPSSSRLSELNSTVYADGIFYDNWKSIEERRESHKPAHRLNTYYSGNIGDLKLDFNADFYKGTTISNAFVTETSQEYDDRKVSSENSVNNQLVASKLVLSYPLLGGRLLAGNEFAYTDRKDVYTNDLNIVP